MGQSDLHTFQQVESREALRACGLSFKCVERVISINHRDYESTAYPP
jgi:hypothetical protein